MIDTAVRATGIGGSDIAALVGLDPRRDAFAVYADKLGLIEREEPNARMRWGKRIERVIIEAYGEETRQRVEWCDETRVSRKHEWQVYTPDAFVIPPRDMGVPAIGGVDAKNVALDQAPLWGEVGTDLVPDHIALQCQWYMSAADLPWWDVAALFGGNDLRIYTIRRDAEIEAVLLAAAERFWLEHVLARNPPPIGDSDAAARYLKQRFPRNVENVRFATEPEAELLARYKLAREAADAADDAKTAVENEVKQCIGDAEGLIHHGWKVTWKRCADTKGPDWEAIARELGASGEIIAKHTKVLREGSRRIHCTFK